MSEPDAEVSWGRELEIRAARKANKAEKSSSKKDAKNSSQEKLPAFTNEDFEIHDAIPFSIITELGDEVVNDETIHKSIRDVFIRKKFAKEIKEEFKVNSAKFFG